MPRLHCQQAEQNIERFMFKPLIEFFLYVFDGADIFAFAFIRFLVKTKAEPSDTVIEEKIPHSDPVAGVLHGTTIDISTHKVWE